MLSVYFIQLSNSLSRKWIDLSGGACGATSAEHPDIPARINHAYVP